MKLIKSLIVSALVVSSLFALTACNADSNTTSSTSENTSASATESTSTTTDEHYPVTIVNYNNKGEEVSITFEKAPEKVLAVYQGSIETMLALGLEDKIIASYGLDNEVKDIWKTNLENANYNADVFSPDKETVIAMQPDFIFSWGSIFADTKLGEVTEWHERGTNTYINTNTRSGGTRTIQNEIDDLLNIGKIFNVEDEAQAIVDEMQAEIDSALVAAQAQETQTVIALEFLSESITNYGETSLPGDIITELGATMAAPTESTLSKEAIIAANPDVIFVIHMPRDVSIEESNQNAVNLIMQDPALASLDAVKNGRIYPIMLGDIYASTVRTIDGIETVSHGLYSELAE